MWNLLRGLFHFQLGAEVQAPIPEPCISCAVGMSVLGWIPSWYWSTKFKSWLVLKPLSSQQTFLITTGLLTKPVFLALHLFWSCTPGQWAHWSILASLSHLAHTNAGSSLPTLLLPGKLVKNHSSSRNSLQDWRIYAVEAFSSITQSISYISYQQTGCKLLIKRDIRFPSVSLVRKPGP